MNDISSDTGIPSVSVLAYDPSTFPQMSEIVWTAGTTPNPHKALIRALTEVAQLAGDFMTRSNYVASGLPKVKSLEEADFVNTP
jgi:ribosomal protein S12 methylthiotransferase accessory factor